MAYLEASALASNSTMGANDDFVGIHDYSNACNFISGVLWVPYTFFLFYLFYEHHVREKFPQNMIMLLLAMGSVVRTVWLFGAHAYQPSIPFLILNRLAILLQFTALAVLILMWLRALQITKIAYAKQNTESTTAALSFHSPQLVRVDSHHSEYSNSGHLSRPSEHRSSMHALMFREVETRHRKVVKYAGVFIFCIWVVILVSLIGDVQVGHTDYDANVIMISSLCLMEAVFTLVVGLRTAVILQKELAPVFLTSSAVKGRRGMTQTRLMSHDSEAGQPLSLRGMCSQMIDCCGMRAFVNLYRLFFYRSDSALGLQLQRDVLRSLLTVSFVTFIFFFLRAVGYLLIYIDTKNTNSTTVDAFFPLFLFQFPELIPTLAIAAGISPPNGILRRMLAWLFCLRPSYAPAGTPKNTQQHSRINGSEIQPRGNSSILQQQRTLDQSQSLSALTAITAGDQLLPPPNHPKKSRRTQRNHQTSPSDGLVRPIEDDDDDDEENNRQPAEDSRDSAVNPLHHSPADQQQDHSPRPTNDTTYTATSTQRNPHAESFAFGPLSENQLPDDVESARQMAISNSSASHPQSRKKTQDSSRKLKKKKKTARSDHSSGKDDDTSQTSRTVKTSFSISSTASGANGAASNTNGSGSGVTPGTSSAASSVLQHLSMSPHRHSRPRHNSAEVDDHLEDNNEEEDEDDEEEDEEDEDDDEEEREGDDRFDVNTTLSTSAPPLATSLNSTSTSSRHPSTNTAHTNQTDHSLLNNTSYNSVLPQQQASGNASTSRSSHSRSMLSLSALLFPRRDQQYNPNHSSSGLSPSSMSNGQYQQQLQQQQQQQQRQESEEYAELLYRLNSYNNVYNNTGNNDIHGIHHPASLSPVVSIDATGRAVVPLPPPADASPQSDPHSSYEPEYAFLAYAAPRNKIHHHQAQLSDDLETPYVQHEDDGETDARRSPSPGHSLHGNAPHQQSALQKSWLSKLLA